MTIKGRYIFGGYTLVEVAVVIIIVGIITAIVTPKIFSITRGAESENVEEMISKLEAGLSAYSARQYLSDKPIMVHNPFEDLTVTPENYLGEAEIVNSKTTPEGCWVWRPTGNWIMYNPKSPIDGGWLNSNESFIIYQVQPVVEHGVTVGLRLTTTDAYTFIWK
jgi:prepilin-type N-terminal cleavage/methylation domain-containing protein